MRVADFLAKLFSRPTLNPSLDVAHLDLTIEGLPQALDGFTLAQVSDLHVGPGDWVPVRGLDAARAIVEARPDVVANTGDFLQHSPSLDAVRAWVQPLIIEPPGGLEGPVNLAVLGNHDYYAGEDMVEGLKVMLAAIGVRSLVNETVTVRKNGAAISFTGLEEREAGFDKALRAAAEVPRPHVVLLHEADVAERLPPDSADLVLAGHTHGGQITLPGLTGLIVRRFNGSKYVQGWYRVNGNRLYINRGLGCTGLPIRFRARPEVTIFRFRR